MIIACKILAACLLVMLPLATWAQSSAASYCQALSDKYQKYVNQSVGRKGSNPDATVSNAIAQCKSGNTVPAIPVLEKALKDAKIDPPPRA